MAIPLVENLASRGKRIIWAPDKYLGSYIQDQTGVDMIMWDGACIVHEEYKTIELKKLIQELGDCEVLVHLNLKKLIQLADVVGSTTKLINASKISKSKNIIVATEKGIFYQMKKLSPEKNFLRLLLKEKAQHVRVVADAHGCTSIHLINSWV